MCTCTCVRVCVCMHNYVCGDDIITLCLWSASIIFSSKSACVNECIYVCICYRAMSKGLYIVIMIVIKDIMSHCTPKLCNGSHNSETTIISIIL